MNLTKNLGKVAGSDAYDLAKSAGYNKTKEQFAEDLAKVGTKADLDEGGKVPEDQLPEHVFDKMEMLRAKVRIPASSWSEEESKFKATVTLEGMTENHFVIVIIEDDLPEGESIRCSGTPESNGVTVYADQAIHVDLENVTVVGLKKPTDTDKSAAIVAANNRPKAAESGETGTPETGGSEITMEDLIGVTNLHVWAKLQVGGVGGILSDRKTTTLNVVEATESVRQWFYAADAVETKADGTVALVNQKSINVTTGSMTLELVKKLTGCYLMKSGDYTGLKDGVIYYISPGSIELTYTNATYLAQTTSWYTVGPDTSLKSLVGYTASEDAAAYPEDGEQDGVYYKYLGQLGNKGLKSQMVTYTGDGVVSQQSVEFAKQPEVVFIRSAETSENHGEAVFVRTAAGGKTVSLYLNGGTISMGMLSYNFSGNTLTWGGATNAACSLSAYGEKYVAKAIFEEW